AGSASGVVAPCGPALGRSNLLRLGRSSARNDARAGFIADVRGIAYEQISVLPWREFAEVDRYADRFGTPAAWNLRLNNRRSGQVFVVCQHDSSERIVEIDIGPIAPVIWLTVHAGVAAHRLGTSSTAIVIGCP